MDDVSLSQTTDLTCPQCGQTFAADVWLIVDGGARPDLLARVREGTLHTLPCPHCDHAGQVDVPLLLYLPEHDPPLLFSPAQGTTQEQDQQQAAQLIGALRQQLGPAWQEAWLKNGLRGIQRAMLPAALSDDPEAALRKLQEQAARELERLRQDDPEAYRQLEQAAAEAMAEENTTAATDLPPTVASLLPVIQTFIQADTWTESQNVVAQHPELLSDDADTLLGQLLDGARAQEDENATRIFGEHRALLRRCREVGVDAAFAEKVRPGGGGE